MYKLNLLALALMVSTSSAFANGVEKRVMPSDAQNVQLMSARVAQYPVGSTDASNALLAHEGYPSSNTLFGPKLELTFAYDSKRESNASPASSIDGDSVNLASSRPTITIVMDASNETLRAIKAKRLDAKNVVKYGMAQEATFIQVSISDCPSNFEGNVDESCTPQSKLVTKQQPVLTVELKSL